MYRALHRPRALLSLVSVVCLLSATPSTAQVQTSALAFETEAFDLETGAVIELTGRAVDQGAGDFHFAYHADRTTHAVTFQSHGTEIALLADTPFANVSASAVASLTFSHDLIDVSCDAGDTLVLRTAAGSVYKIGNLLEDPTSGVVLFDYELLEVRSDVGGGELPPPGLSSGAWQAITGYLERDLAMEQPTAASAPSEIVYEDAKLLASDGASGDHFGDSVAVSGDTVVVGAHGDDDRGLASGSAYIFVRPAGGWSGTLTEAAKLLASDGATLDFFGESVAVSGDTVVVGVWGDDDQGSDSGSAYVFEKPLGGWSGTLTEAAKLVASDGASDDWFGVSVAVSGDTVVVGAYWDDDRGSVSGSAYIFVRPSGGWFGTLNESAKLLASDGASGDFFGASVAVSGDTVVVGAYGDGDQGQRSGSAYVFQRPAGGWSGTLAESAKLLASDGASRDRFGESVSVSGDTVAVGRRPDDGQGSISGYAYVFEKPAGGWIGTLGEDAKLLAGDGVTEPQPGLHWIDSSVSVSGHRVVLGAWPDDEQGPISGSAFVFGEPAGGWSGTLIEDANLLASDGASNDRFGRSVSVSVDTVVVGAWGDDEQGSGSGSAYIFELAPSNQPPVCSAVAWVSGECDGATTTVTGLDGSASSDPDLDPLTFSWTTDCPGGVFDDATSATPTLAVDSVAPGVCDPLTCNATLTVADDGGLSDTCAPTQVAVEDTLAPVLTLDTMPIRVTDADCSGEESVSLPTAGADDQCEGFVQPGHDAPESFPAGQTTLVTYTATDECSNSSQAGVPVTVLFGADIAVSAIRHTVGGGSSQEPLVGIEVCAYDKAQGGCPRVTCGGISHRHYQCILDSCDSVNAGFNAACCTTDADGECTINAPPGDYLVISGDATKTVLEDPLGGTVGRLSCGQVKHKRLQQIVKVGGKKGSAKSSRRSK